MKALKVLYGLVYDDVWLFGGTVVSVALAALLAGAGPGLLPGTVLTLGVVASLSFSLFRAKA